MLLLRRLRPHTIVIGNPFVAYAVLLAVLCLVSILWPNDTDLLTYVTDSGQPSILENFDCICFSVPSTHISRSVLILFFLWTSFSGPNILFEIICFLIYFHPFLLFPTHVKGYRHQQHHNNIYFLSSIFVLSAFSSMFTHKYIQLSIYNRFNTAIVYIRIPCLSVTSRVYVCVLRGI